MDNLEIKYKNENDNLRWETRQQLYYAGLLYLGSVILNSDKEPLWMPLVSGGLLIASLVKAIVIDVPEGVKDYIKTKVINDNKIKENNAKVKSLKKE